MIELSGSNLTTVVVVAVIALAALVVAAVLVRQVLAASEGTDNMKSIAAEIPWLNICSTAPWMPAGVKTAMPSRQ